MARAPLSQRSLDKVILPGYCHGTQGQEYGNVIWLAGTWTEFLILLFFFFFTTDVLPTV